jgi:hypothetical protein
MGQLLTLSLILVYNLLHLLGSQGKIGPNFFNDSSRGGFFLFRHFSREADDIQHLMEETLRRCHADLPANFDIYRVVHLPCQSRALDVDNADGLHTGSLLAIAHNTDQILSLA